MYFKDVVISPKDLMGAKAVWGRSTEAVMCFSKEGTARSTAERAQAQRYFVTVGAGRQAPNEIEGRALELVRATGVYGPTKAFVQDEDLRLRLAQWPAAIIVSEVYRIVGEPRLIEDLYLPDRLILQNAFDAVSGRDDRVKALWKALETNEIERRWEISLPPGFYDPGKVVLVGSIYPNVSISSPEGKRRWELQQKAERDPKLKKEAKRLNRQKNGGLVKCEACDLIDKLDGMFDAHHLRPLAAGERETRADDLAVLCPTCHRCAHRKASDPLSPVPVSEILKLLRRGNIA